MINKVSFKRPAICDLGCFRVSSGAVTAADPAYAHDVGKDYVVNFKAKNGLWKAVIEQTEGRVVSIIARHVDYPDADPDVPMKGTVGVDTASAGFFDAKSRLGVVTSSGYGDGGYRCLVARNGNQAVAAKIVFIDAHGGKANDW